MNIIGIGGYSHDSAACLLRDGDIVAAAMEERFTRRKHQNGIPHKAIQYCLDQGGINRDDVAHITAYMKPLYRLARRLPYRIHTALRSPRYAAIYTLYELVHNFEYYRGTRGLLGKNTQLHFMNHHQAHVAGSFFCSPFEEAAALSIDYIGEWASTYAAHAHGTSIDRLFECHYPQSLGVLYSALTDYLGFIRANDEYKVMGLASFGDPARFRAEFERMVRLTPNGGFSIDLRYFQYHYLPGSLKGYVSPLFIKTFGPSRSKTDPIEQIHKDIAAALQERLELAVFHILRHLHTICPANNCLCLAGGVALNSVLNGKILHETPYEELYIQPAAGDDGIAIGGALYCHHALLGNARSKSHELTHALLGPSYTDDDILRLLEEAKVPYRKLDDPAKTAAQLIANGKIVGWFSGRMEFGPRALGARSILADATNPEMQDIVNHFVKHREDFRPFAPAVPEEDAARYFDIFGKPNANSAARFMLMVVPVRKQYRDKLPAVTHIDGSARLQTVRQQDNPHYYAILREFEKIKGIPVVLNTSFNVRGEPIVCSPDDALRCYSSTGIDALILENYLVVKSDRVLP
jgi:carbamoyltransferase